MTPLLIARCSLLIALFAVSAQAVPAFLGAEGGGSLAVGGRGGAVIEVANLNDSGAGSLRNCINAAGPRTCVFLTGGTIVLNTGLVISNPFITIAGQTAPGGGIQLTNSSGENDDFVRIATHDVIFRYIRARLQAPFTGAHNIFSVLNPSVNVYNVMWDHCSAAFATWDSYGVWMSGGPISYNSTFQWGILAEPVYPTNGSSQVNISGADSATSDQMTDIDTHHTYFTGGTHRAPISRIKRARIINNLVYNHSYYDIKGGGNTDIVGNYIKTGPTGFAPHEIQGWTTPDVGTTARLSLYIAGNAADSNSFNPNADQWSGNLTAVAVGEDSSDSFLAVPIPTTYQRTSPLAATGMPITVDPAASVPAILLGSLGAGTSAKLSDTACDGSWVPNRDALDNRYVNEFNSNTGHAANIMAPGALAGLASGSPCAQSLHDGIPDHWKSLHGLSLTDATLSAKIDSSTGYTYLEDYLNGNGAGGAPHVILAKTTDKSTATAGMVVTYTIQYQNTGSGNATNFVIKDAIPTGTTLVAGSITAGGTLSAGTITWTIGTVTAGAPAASVSFKVTVN